MMKGTVMFGWKSNDYIVIKTSDLNISVRICAADALDTSFSSSIFVLY